MRFQPPVSPIARQTVKAAFDDLDQVILPEDSIDFHKTSLEDVRKSVLTIEDQLAARKALRNMRRLLPLFAGLEHYAKAVDILCSGTPFLTWIWAPIGLILRIASEYLEAFDKLIKGYSQIAECLGRFSILHSALSTNQDFQQTLAAFYANILKFHEHAYTFVRRKSWKLLFLTSWGRFERRLDNILDDMKRHENLVDLQANAHGISDIRQIREEIRSWREESKDKMLKWHEKQANKQYNSILAWLKADETEQLAILESITSEGAKFTGTCSWVMNNAKTKSWLEKNPESSVLWLQGSAGSGKSVLAGQIIGSMRDEGRFLIHHFCSQKYASSTTYEQIIRSILLQLLRKDDELIAHVHEDCVLGKKAPTVHDLEKLLYNLFTITSRGPRQSEYVWIIIDGLNECETQIQSNVINLINQITSRLSRTGDRACKILLCSRRDTLIASRLRTKQIISLTEEKSSVKLAIKQYVSQRLRATPMHEKLAELEFTRKDIDNIEKLITSKSDGMFLYARLVLDYLSRNIYVDENEMKDAINELPVEISEFYQKILVQILVQLDPRSVERIGWVFSWIAYAKRPLKRMELLSALTFSFRNSKPSKLVPRYVLDICGALVEERSDTSLTFIHISVKDFLQSPTSRLDISEAEAMKKHCLSILAYLDYSLGVFLDDKGEYKKETDKASSVRELHVIKGIHGFHVYATEFWTDYLLHHFEAHPAGDPSEVLEPALCLANKLHELKDTSRTDSTVPSPSVDGRMKCLEEWPLLEKCVGESLLARSLQQLESSLRDELDPSMDEDDQEKVNTVTPSNDRDSNSVALRGGDDGISLMQSSYQKVVRFLLEQDQYPGVSAEDLELFKSQFRDSAFTCRLSLCPRATIGFESEELRQQHEIAHTQLLMCSAPECRYPPFTSLRALKNHTNRYHRNVPVVRPSKRLMQPSLSKLNASSTRQSGWIDLRQETSRTDLMNSSDDHNMSNDDNRISNTEKPSISGQMVLRSSYSGNPDNVSRNPHRKKQDFTGLDEKSGYYIVCIGYRICDIPGCGMIIDTGTREEIFNEGKMVHASAHYWSCHHVSKGYLKCSEYVCTMGPNYFDWEEELAQHYERQHTRLYCSACDENLIIKSDVAVLRHHWRASHLTLVDRWVCDDSKAKEAPWPAASFKCCESCKQARRFKGKEDAIAHLLTEHAGQMTSQGIAEFLPFLEIFVRRKRVYEAAKHVGDQFGGIYEVIDDNIDDDLVL